MRPATTRRHRSSSGYTWLFAVVAVAVFVIFAACGSEPPAPTPTPVATETAIPTETAAPSATATTPPATATPLPPTATPRPAAPVPPAGGVSSEVVRGDASKPMVALTFDSGSVAGETSKVLDILARNQVRSSWFITGQFAEKNPNLVRRAAQEGQEVFNHSYSHPDLRTLSDAEIVQEMNQAEEILRGITGKTTKPYMRMPFGGRDARVLRIVGGLGYRSIYWTLDSGDWREGWTPDMVREQVLGNVGNGYVVVHHSSPVATSASLETIIRTLKERGFQLVTVSTLLGQQGGGVSYRTASPDQTPDGDYLFALVNKQVHLAEDYVPGDLRDFTANGVPALYRGMQLRGVAATPLARLAAAAKSDGLELSVLSAYRSYQEQGFIYQREVVAQGQAQAERVVALPGHSQHQLGTTVDFTARSVSLDLSESFGETAEGRWLMANAHRFGFVMSYPKGKEHITGYAYEPWHYRYIGENAAADLMRRGITLEEYLSASR